MSFSNRCWMKNLSGGMKIIESAYLFPLLMSYLLVDIATSLSADSPWKKTLLSIFFATKA